MTKIIKKKVKGTEYTLCEHFANLPERLKPALSFSHHYCPTCGQKLFRKGWTMKDACSNCGEYLCEVGDMDRNYCGFCGEKFDG